MASKDPTNEEGQCDGPVDLSPAKQMEDLLDQLHARTRLVRDTWHASEAARLKILARQLALLTEGSGSESIRESAAELEAVLLAEEAEASAMCERVESLIQQCRDAANS